MSLVQAPLPSSRIMYPLETPDTVALFIIQPPKPAHLGRDTWGWTKNTKGDCRKQEKRSLDSSLWNPMVASANHICVQQSRKKLKQAIIACNGKVKRRKKTTQSASSLKQLSSHKIIESCKTNFSIFVFFLFFVYFSLLTCVCFGVSASLCGVSCQGTHRLTTPLGRRKEEQLQCVKTLRESFQRPSTLITSQPQITSTPRNGSLIFSAHV